MTQIHSELQKLIDSGLVKSRLDCFEGKGFTLMYSLTPLGNDIAKQAELNIDERELAGFLRYAENDLKELY